jgi:hypothetical protein
MPEATPQAMDSRCLLISGERSNALTMPQCNKSRPPPAGPLISSMTSAARPVQGQQKPYTYISSDGGRWYNGELHCDVGHHGKAPRFKKQLEKLGTETCPIAFMAMPCCGQEFNTPSKQSGWHLTLTMCGWFKVSNAATSDTSSRSYGGGVTGARVVGDPGGGGYTHENHGNVAC